MSQLEYVCLLSDTKVKGHLRTKIRSSAADPRGGSPGSQDPLGHGLRPPESVANITVKERVYRPTQELVSM